MVDFHVLPRGDTAVGWAGCETDVAAAAACQACGKSSGSRLAG